MRNGKVIKKEFRGHRSVESFTEFVRKQLEDPIKEFKNISDIQLTEPDQVYVMGKYKFELFCLQWKQNGVFVSLKCMPYLNVSLVLKVYFFRKRNGEINNLW